MTMPGRPFVWYELMTSDADAAQKFYQAVFGWQMRDSGTPGMQYTLIANDGVVFGGLFSFVSHDCGDGARPCWLGYIGSPDVDDDVRRLEAAGGKVLKAPTDIPGVGRFAVVADPHGAVFQLFQMNEPMPAGAPMSPGRIAWHELHAGDGAADWEFYATLFGWTIEQDLDMGPQGVYRVFQVDGTSTGGMMTKTPGMPVPMWMYYVAVKDIDATMAKANAAGGKLVMGPHEVPGGAWIAQFVDPQGAMFAMVGGRGGSC